MQSEYSEFVRLPNETMSTEYKEWLDLANSPELRASLARHIAAISNYGGGIIVIGFRDADLSTCGDDPYLFEYSRDAIAGISKRYLEPPVHCDVVFETDEKGHRHPLIIVPSHQSTPICAKANGPDSDGKPRGIVQGTHYIRKAGPESAPITSASEWLPLIRKCAMHERTAILAAVTAALDPTRNTPARAANELRTWHDAARVEYERALAQSVAPMDIATNNVQLSYTIERGDGQLLKPTALLEIARQTNREIRDRANTGWSMFFPFERDPIPPYLNSDERVGAEVSEFLESNLLIDDGPIADDADFWRLSVDGRATILRPYRFDFLSEKPPGWNTAVGLVLAIYFVRSASFCGMRKHIRSGLTLPLQSKCFASGAG